MGSDPASSVTDKWGQVWGHQHLHIVDASLHVTNGGVNPVLTILANAYRMLAPGGTLAVMDSPMFRADREESDVVDDRMRRGVIHCGLTDVVPQGSGYLTFGRLAAFAEQLQLRPEFLPSRGPLRWRLRRHGQWRPGPATSAIWSGSPTRARSPA